jgi:amidophosphoribosyltransferase
MCAIAGIYGGQKAAELIFLAQHAQQHRATDSAGIATTDGAHLYNRAGSGIIQDVFGQADLDKLHGRAAISHLRYSTVDDDPTRDNTQPILMPFEGEEVAIAHNGNLTNVETLIEEFPEGVSLKTSMDTEIILRRFCLANGPTINDRIIQALQGVRGSYSLLMLFPDRLIAIRDSSGNRPLSLGQRDGAFCVASETCALEAIDANFIRDIKPGEILTISEAGLHSTQLPWATDSHQAMCIFEKIYYAHPASVVYQEDKGEEAVADFRFRLGQELEKIHPVPNADIVVGVPASAQFMALGYASSGRSGNFSPSIQRSHYIGRSFIQPNQAIRDTKVARKFGLIRRGRYGLEGKVVVVVDDSLVRGTTAKLLLSKIWACKPKEVHFRSACPPIRYHCRYGIDTKGNAELAAATMTNEQLRQMLEVDTLEFLPLEALHGLITTPKRYCFACMDGDYRICQQANTTITQRI